MTEGEGTADHGVENGGLKRRRALRFTHSSISQLLFLYHQLKNDGRRSRGD